MATRQHMNRRAEQTRQTRPVTPVIARAGQLRVLVEVDAPGVFVARGEAAAEVVLEAVEEAGDFGGEGGEEGPGFEGDEAGFELVAFDVGLLVVLAGAVLEEGFAAALGGGEGFEDGFPFLGVGRQDVGDGG